MMGKATSGLRAVAVGLCLALAACAPVPGPGPAGGSGGGTGGGTGGGGGGNTGVPGSVRITNETAYHLKWIWLRPSVSAAWGNSRNGVTPVPPWASWTVTGVPEGFHDAAAGIAGAYSNYFAYAMDVFVTSGNQVSLQARPQGFTGSLSFTNGNYSFALTELYVAPATATTWGLNLLAGALAPGAAWLVYDMPAGIYDVMCVHASGAWSTGVFTVSSLSTTFVTCY